MQYQDYYKTLGVDRKASQSDIKKAYRKLARKYHPDVSKEADAEEHFKEVGEAYEALKNPEKRASYDQLGSQWQSGEEFSPPPDWNTGYEYGGGFAGADGSAFSDFFESLFSAAQTAPGADFHAQAQNSHAKVLIDIEDAYRGATRTLVLRHPALDANGHIAYHQRQLKVNIPKGVYAGQHIRLKGQGDPGIGQGQPGDLFLEIEFNAHSIYRVEGKNVYLQLPVTPWEAALGEQITVPTPVGKVKLKIPPGASHGKQMRLKGKGIPSKAPGDFYVNLEIAVLPAESSEARQAYETLKKVAGFNPRHHLGV